jgi:hypothetical protein
MDAITRETMQTPYPEQTTSPTTFFSRERRRKRMLQFLEAFERRSRRIAPEIAEYGPLQSHLRPEPRPAAPVKLRS